MIEIAEAELNDGEVVDKAGVDEDWLSFFFRTAEMVSDEQMQSVLGRILAEEVSHPDSISRSLIQTLSIISGKQARFFCNIARFCWSEYQKDSIHPFIFISSEQYSYRNSGITWEKLKELERLGLVQCDVTVGYSLKGDRIFRRGNVLAEVKANPNLKNRIPTGNVILTEDGQRLYHMISPENREFRSDIFQFIVKELEEKGCPVNINNRYNR